MVAEWHMIDDGKGGFQSHFSHHSVTIQSTEWQAHFSELLVNFFFLKNKITPELHSECKDQRESTLTIRPQGLLFSLRNIWYMSSLCLNLYLELAFLIFNSFYNHQLNSYSALNGIY